MEHAINVGGGGMCHAGVLSTAIVGGSRGMPPLGKYLQWIL